MKKIYLCGHTGSDNHGCEAIVRSTVKVLFQAGMKKGVSLATSAPEQDRKYDLDRVVELIPYQKKYPDRIVRYLNSIRKRVFRNQLAGQKNYHSPVLDRISDTDVCMNIGGDTYCYGFPTQSVALNLLMSRKKIPTVLWCCSIERDAITKTVKDDLLRYSYIVAREQYTVDNLLDAGIPKDNILKCCDPAFLLDMEQVNLPKGFAEGNTIGLNISPMVIHDCNESDMGYQNVKFLVDYLLANTDFNICFIPHVYNFANKSGDIALINEFIQKYPQNGRIFTVDSDYNCEQLKYIISKCRFFIGARTHSTIAAYSTSVPTLVIGYSVKSKGIANDLFGKDIGYVLPYDTMTHKDDLLKTFVVNIMQREDEIKEIYSRILPQYKETIGIVASQLMHEFNLLENNSNVGTRLKQECNGCGLCEKVCPQKCITMKEDYKGFVYPRIDSKRCISCGLCEKHCPINHWNCKNSVDKVFGIKNSDVFTQKTSSSGGFFSALAESFIQNGGVVFGAAFSETFGVRHIRVEDLENINQIKGSKYVQSNISECFSKIQSDLKHGKKVLFAGTPCQVAAIRSFFGPEHYSLFLVDIICHGVPSPKIWNEYIESLEKEYGANAVRVSFRDKEMGWNKYRIVIDFSNGKKYSVPAKDDPFFKSYILGMDMRESCASCPFKSHNRESDLTIGDFWGIENIDPSFYDEYGISAVITHNERGEQLVKACGGKCTMKSYRLSDVQKNNPSYFLPSDMSVFEKDFFRKAKQKSLNEICDDYYSGKIYGRIAWEIKQIRRM